MKALYTLIAGLALAFNASAQEFARGADTSWSTEMEADGHQFYNAQGQPTEISTLMKSIGMNAVRLRVWVDPSLGGWCTTDDVVKKAVAAKEAGLDVLVDFHYSDFFADPSRQAIPAGWAGRSVEFLALAVGMHTTQVLGALNDAGVEPKWVQIGNETRNGILYSTYNGDGTWSNAAGETGSTSTQYGGSWSNFAQIINAGYTMAKSIFPNTTCMVHLDTRSSDTDLSWWIQNFRDAGGKMDMLGLSHYPAGWNAGGESQAQTNGLQRNTQLMQIIDTTEELLQLPIMIVETGVYCEYTSAGKVIMQDLMDKCRARSYVKGVFYWEPEQYNWWKPAVYNTIGWNNYNMCAFYNNGQPSPILDPFAPTAEEAAYEAGVGAVTVDETRGGAPAAVYDALGRRVRSDVAKGVVIEDGRKVLK